MEQTTGVTATILVVEDEPLVRFTGALLLEDAGFIVIEACDGDTALRILEVNPDIRIVFTDVEMPGALDGLGLARYIHERWPAIGVIVTSGRYRPLRGQNGRDELFVAKPYAADTLIPKIAACLSAAAA